jgi:hypothetical protein
LINLEQQRTNTIIVTPFGPNQLEQDKNDFKRLFDSFGTVLNVVWLSSFNRILVVYETYLAAERAKPALDRSEFKGTELRAYYGNPVSSFTDFVEELHPPEQDKLFLISPPASPPIGWAQIREDEPIKNPHGHLEVEHLIDLLHQHVVTQLSVSGDGDMAADGVTSMTIFKPDRLSCEDLPCITVENVDGEEIDTSGFGLIAKSHAKTRIPSR